ncbi:hypothetical protein DY000_02015115 [Brassica cretica]|uniref:Uncharacterized protein n=1 Tax=Brassica cretica TaxID=69181 RepID=A0ABQ7CNG6_BRACR|nr:hypothetical protein DY000_02015115 [Brassica cretica]
MVSQIVWLGVKDVFTQIAKDVVGRGLDHGGAKDDQEDFPGDEILATDRGARGRMVRPWREADVGVKIGHDGCSFSRSKLQKPRKRTAETDQTASSAATRASSPGEHSRVAGRLARSCRRSARPVTAANSPWTIPNPVPSHNHASSSEVSVTQSSGPLIRHQCSV